MSVESSQLKPFYPLDSLRPDHLEALARDAEGEELGRGAVLFRQGESDELSYYLAAGEIRGDYPDGRVKNLAADSLQARYPIGDLQPRRFTATVSSLTATLIKLDRRFTERVLAWDQITKQQSFKLYDPQPENNRWVFRLLQSRALRKVPVGNLERLFTRFQQIPVLEGQVIVREGDPGDYFYVIKDGAAAVAQTVDGAPSVVAYLVRGDSFGEDALLANVPRNATVTMMKSGKLMRLAKSDFLELLKQPVVEWITPGKASLQVRGGAGVLDVRTKEEFDERSIKGAVNMPLYRLREYAQELDKGRKYIVYCNTGERSAAAAFILNKLGFDAVALQGGLSAMVKQLDKAAAGGE